MPSSSPEPELSFVVPARDEELLLPAALASIAAQRPSPSGIEVVVVDSASADGTAHTARTFARAHPELPVRVVREPRGGRGRAKNAGARAAAGEILIFLDADSRAAPDLAAAVRRRGRDHAAGAIRIIADSSDRLDRWYFALMRVGPRLFGIRAQLFYCRRELFLAAGGFREELEVAEDKEFLDRLRRAGHSVCYLDESWIATSPRRLRRLPLRIGMLTMFARWFLASFGIGRRWRY